MTTLTVIIPMFDEAEHIARTLLAARRAADAAGLTCDLLVIDNGSQDDSVDIARRHGAQVLSAPGIAIGALRNLGAAASTGEWLAFLDADVELPADGLSVMLARHADGVGEVFALACDTPSQAPWFARAWQRRTLHPGPPLQTVNWLPSTNLLLPRSWFERCGGFDPHLRTGEDKDFTLRLHQLGARLCVLRRPVALHWGYERSWPEWMGKEMWRQGGHVQLLHSQGWSLRLLRFPLMAVGVWVCDLVAVSAALHGFHVIALGLLLAVALSPLIQSLRQSIPLRDLRLGLHLWLLHLIRLHLAGAAIVLGVVDRAARRPARG